MTTGGHVEQAPVHELLREGFGVSARGQYGIGGVNNEGGRRDLVDRYLPADHFASRLGIENSTGRPRAQRQERGVDGSQFGPLSVVQLSPGNPGRETHE